MPSNPWLESGKLNLIRAVYGTWQERWTAVASWCLVLLALLVIAFAVWLAWE